MFGLFITLLVFEFFISIEVVFVRERAGTRQITPKISVFPYNQCVMMQAQGCAG
jgi:hypothetical protein